MALTVTTPASAENTPNPEDLQLPAAYFERGNNSAATGGESVSATPPGLFIAKYTYVPFRLQFKAANRLPDGTLQFQLNLLDVTKHRTRFVKTGDEVEDWRVGEYREKTIQEKRDGAVYRIDRSELDLIHRQFNEPLVLTLNQLVKVDESHVTISAAAPDAMVSPSELRRGDRFVLRWLAGGPVAQEFQLLTVSATGAIVKNLKTDVETNVKLPSAGGAKTTD